MRNRSKISAILLILLAAGSFSLIAQRGMMRGMRPDSAGMDMRRMDRMHMHRMMQGTDSLMEGRMERGMGHMYMRAMCPCMEMMWGMHRRFRGEWHQGMYMPIPRPGMWMLENIPNLTDKQKKDIAELRQNQQAEMQKFRSDMQKKMQEMRASNRSKVMNLLTDEQRKWLKENTFGRPERPERPEAPEQPEK